jgi:hypothetical protein
VTSLRRNQDGGRGEVLPAWSRPPARATGFPPPRPAPGRVALWTGDNKVDVLHVACVVQHPLERSDRVDAVLVMSRQLPDRSGDWRADLRLAGRETAGSGRGRGDSNPTPLIDSGTAAVRADAMTSAPGVSSATETTMVRARSASASSVR